MNATPQMTDSMIAAIGWFYLITNSARIFTYIPQIFAVWRCQDGARAISLLTWGPWVVSHLAAIAYGVLVVHDVFFVVISAINLSGCAAVAVLAAHRRGLLGGTAVLRAGAGSPVAKGTEPRRC